MKIINCRRMIMRKLRKSEINRIIKENSALSNEDLINKYFDIVYHDVLGSQAERMEEAGIGKRLDVVGKSDPRPAFRQLELAER